MKDLKENIKKYNMKKLVLSAVLGMFYYCANNAMEHKEEEKKEKITINEVLITMLECQNNINEAKNAIKKLEPRIYSTIKDKDGKVKKEKLLEFIKNQIKNIKNKNTTKYTKYNRLKFTMKKIEKYFHLEEKEKDYECTKDNLTEIFWNNEQKKETQKIKGPITAIQRYFIRIASNEAKINNTFKEYYKAKKTAKEVGGGEEVENKVIEEIMQECCGKEEGGDIPTKFFGNLRKLCDNDQNLKGNKEAILAAIQRRITLNEPIKEEDIKSFLKQKIGEEKKVVEQKILEIDVNPKEECCHCC